MKSYEAGVNFTIIFIIHVTTCVCSETSDFVVEKTEEFQYVWSQSNIYTLIYLLIGVLCRVQEHFTYTVAASIMVGENQALNP